VVVFRVGLANATRHGTDPSPVPLLLAKAPSRDTLSPLERAAFPTSHRRYPTEDVGNDQSTGEDEACDF
jgi:hypothetical protein